MKTTKIYGRKILRFDESLMIFLVNACRSENTTWSLPEFPSIPKDARVVAVYPNYEYRTLDFIVESETFMPINDGCAITVEKIPAMMAAMRTFQNPFADTKNDERVSALSQEVEERRRDAQKDLATIGILRRALADAIATYDPAREETLVTAERQEAWIAALKS